MERQLMWSGALLDPSGYGEASRQYVLGLANTAGLRLQIKPKYFWAGDTPDLQGQLDQLLWLGQQTVDVRRPYAFLQHLTPDQYRLGPGYCKYHVGLTCFETDSLPATWQMPMRAMDELWTFSQWGRQMFHEAGIRRPVHVIPHGVDTDMFTPDGPAETTDFKGKLFVFGSNFDWTARKNPEALITAYLRTFEPGEQVLLALKAYHQFPLERSVAFIKGAVARIKSQLRLTDAPPILLFPDIMAPQRLARWYRMLDCYVLPSRGEAWGLTYSEAMATGLPTIAVNWSGQTEFMTDENAYLLKDYRLTEIPGEMVQHQPHYAGHRWADCSVEELGATMRRVFEHPDRGRETGIRARTDMVERWSWRQAVAAARRRLEAILGSM